ncbi:MAG: cytochrome c peroxidase, partial [Alphaproteobacteria bacterium]|nr:cytochrome c peroxidase [Alphaproteobacteria bacterium]
MSTIAFADVVRPKNLPPALEDKDFRPLDMAQVRLGQLLFYDKILSGNKNIACGTCHHHKFASGDGLSLPVGEGGEGLGPDRTSGQGEDLIQQRVPRHSPTLFNLGAYEFFRLFADGRVSVDDYNPSGFKTPEEDDFPHGLDNIVAVQAMFPVTSETEMAGNDGENDIARIAHRDTEDIWPLIARRLQDIPEYVSLFKEAFPTKVKTKQDITMVLAANALAAFEMFEWRADQSPFDQYLRGDDTALTSTQKRGLDLFYGKANCVSCHSGPLLTDHDFHAIAIPQLGWVRTRRFDFVVRDRGRINETDKLEDAYKFRTPSLRN